ncbi:sigma-70 family RNA polymerase sigma factor [Lachnospiraceae bacterium 46-15]
MERDRLIEENIRLAYWTAERFRGCGMEHDDIAGCCLLGLVEAARDYMPEKGKFTTFAVRVMQYKVYPELRKARRKKRSGCYMVSLDAEQEDGLRLAEMIPDPHDGYSEVEAAMLYGKWMEKLTGREKEAAQFVVGEGLSQEDAARRMGIAQSYVSRIMKSARRKMEALCAG